MKHHATAFRSPVQPSPFEAERRALDLPPTVDKREAAAIAKVSPRAVERWIATGALRAARAHRAGSSRVIIKTRDLLEYLGVGAEV